MMHCWRPVTAVVVAVCLLVAGCVSEWDRGMQALKADPIASASWEGLELLSAEETRNEGHKPKPPSITRCYRLTIPPDEAFSKVIKTAEEYGWVEDVSVRTSHDAVARKTINNSVASVLLSAQSQVCDKAVSSQFQIIIHYR